MGKHFKCNIYALPCLPVPPHCAKIAMFSHKKFNSMSELIRYKWQYFAVPWKSQKFTIFLCEWLVERCSLCPLLGHTFTTHKVDGGYSPPPLKKFIVLLISTWIMKVLDIHYPPHKNVDPKTIFYEVFMLVVCTRSFWACITSVDL